MKIGRMFLIGICLMAVGCGSSDGKKEADSPASRIGNATKKRVELTIVSWEETQRRIAAHKGKIVVLDAWSTSCGPCMKEFPNLVTLHEKHAGKEVVCMSLSVDYDGIASKPPESYRERVLKFLTKQNATFENFLLNQESTEWFDSIALAAIPAVFVFDREGHLNKRFDNDNISGDEEAFTYEDVNRLVEELLAQQ